MKYWGGKEDEPDEAPLVPVDRLVILHKILLWFPYVLSQCFLFWLCIWLVIGGGLPKDNQLFAGAMIALYGALLIGSRDIRAKFWPK